MTGAYQTGVHAGILITQKAYETVSSQSPAYEYFTFLSADTLCDSANTS
jgi:hypothetical protein